MKTLDFLVSDMKNNGEYVEPEKETNETDSIDFSVISEMIDNATKDYKNIIDAQSELIEKQNTVLDEIQKKFNDFNRGNADKINNTSANVTNVTTETNESEV